MTTIPTGHAVLSGDGPAWFERLRGAAAERYARLGLPAKWREDWKHTDLRALRSAAASPPCERGRATEAELGLVLEAPAARLVFVDGAFDAPLSRTDDTARGLSVASLATVLDADPGRVRPWLGLSALVEDGPFVALNTAILRDGAFIEVARGALIEAPVEVIFVTTESSQPGATHPRVVVGVGEGAHVTVVERHVGLGRQAYFTNAVTELVPSRDATIRHLRVQDEGPGAFHLGTVVGRTAHNAHIASTVVTLGAAHSRTAVWAQLAGERSSCALNGLYAPAKEQRHDHYTLIDHSVPECTSSELYHGVVAGAAIGSFLGRVLIGKGAVGSSTEQLCRTLLLTEAARANTRPQLEIDNDDVKATHGATVGQLDPDALFYLRSRGLTELAARGLLIQGFVRTVLDQSDVAELADGLADRVVGRGVEEPA